MGFLKNSIATKFAFLIVALVFVTVVLTGVVFVGQNVSHTSNIEREAVLTDLKVAALKLTHDFEPLPKTISSFEKTPIIQKYFAGEAFTEIEMSRLQHFIGEFLSSWTNLGSLCLKRELDQSFKCFSQAGPLDELNSPYFEDLSSSFANNDNFSQPVLKRIAGKMVQPLTSVLYYRRAVTSDVDNVHEGNIIVEYLFEQNIQKALLELKHLAQMIIFNANGEYLYHPSGYKNWGITLGAGYNAFEEYPQFKSEPVVFGKSNQSEILTGIKVDHLSEDEAYGFGKVILDRESKIFLNLAIIKNTAQQLHANDFINKAGFISLLVIVGMGTMIGWFFSRYLTRYLNEITDVARKFAKGETDVSVEVKTSDEIGVLATAFQGMVRQVNERTRILRKNEREIREARDQAEQALKSKSDLFEDLKIQKNEIEKISKDKDDLLAIVSHDLKNPLAVIETSLDIMMEDQDSKISQTAQDLIRRSKNSAKFALNLITDLLDLARLEGGIKLDFEKFNVSEMMRNVLDGFYIKSSEKNIQVNFNTVGDYEIYADYGRVVQVIHNILGNSLKFTPKNGRVDIDVTVENATSEGQEKNLIIKISDNGPGIPSDKIDKIFNKFEQARTSDRAIGTGLGLAICKNIVQMHNGQILVESEEGAGSTFTISLPRVVGESAIVTKAHNPNILVVAQDHVAQERMVKQLEQSHFEVTVIHQMNDLLPLLKRPDLEFDIFLVQHDLMFKEDQSLLDWITKQPLLNKIPLIALSDQVNAEIIDGIRGLASDFYGISFPYQELEGKILRILNRVDEIYEKKIRQDRKTIMVVEDEEGIRDIIAEKIQTMDINAIKAKNGVEALFLMKKYPVDLVLTDIRMPELDGLSLTRLVRKSYPNVDIVLMSSTTVEIPEELMKRMGVKALLAKPFDIDSLDELFQPYLVSNINPSEQNVGSPPIQTQNELQKILLVDDSEDMHLLFDVLLKGLSIEIKHCFNGLEGLQNFENNHYDAIFMDVNMPVMDGLEAIRKMREVEMKDGRSQTKVVVISANNSSEDIKKYLETGFNLAVAKPVSKQKILDALKRDHS